MLLGFLLATAIIATLFGDAYSLLAQTFALAALFFIAGMVLAVTQTRGALGSGQRMAPSPGPTR